MIIEKYSEDLDKYIGLIHEATEGRYNLTGYDLHVIEAALDELQEFKNKNEATVKRANPKICARYYVCQLREHNKVCRKNRSCYE